MVSLRKITQDALRQTYYWVPIQNWNKEWTDKDLYQKYKSQGESLEVYAINIEQETAGYLKYLREHEYSWINVQDTAHLSRFRDYYDIYSTPVAFVLDKERKIIGKRIDPAAIDDFLKQVFEDKKKKGINPKKEEEE